MKSKIPALISISNEASIALCSFTLAITEASSEKEIYVKLSESLPKILQADRSSVTLITDYENDFEVFSLHGIDGILSIGKYFPVNNSLAGLAVKHQKTRISKINANNTEVDAQQLYQQGLACIMNAPLQFSDRIIGTVNVASSDENAYNHNTSKLLTLITTLVSNYIERQHLLEQAQIGIKQYKTYAKKLEYLNLVAEELSAATNENDVFSIITRSASNIISAQRISYFIPNYQKKHFKIQALFSESKIKTPTIIPMENTSLQLVLQSGQPHFFENLAETSFNDHVMLTKKGLCVAWSVPVRVKGEIVGLLNAASNKKVNEISQQLSLLKMLSGIMGVTLSRLGLQVQLEYQARYDTLTGLPNRHQFNQMMELIITQENPTPFTLLFIDLDRFKIVNDTMGHNVGDELLCRVSQRIHQQIRKEDFAARHGGDEFIVLLLNHQSKNIAGITSARIINALKKPFKISEYSISIGASIGISHFPEHTKNSEELIKYADIAMYHAKKKGRNNYELYSSRLSKKIYSRQQLDTLLRLAVKNKELHLVFQVQTDKNGVFAIEALLRWEHPELGSFLPEEFIPIAEESLLIEEITHWAINQSLQVIKRLRFTWPSLYVAVHISAKVFLYPGKLKNYILTALNDYNLPGSALELEITENVFLQDIENTTKLFKDLSSYDIRFAIDDFGIGYSSLTYLLDSPLDTLKISSSFIKNIHYNKTKLGVVEGLLVIANSLSMNCLAKGVEFEEQIYCLKKLGYDHFQGDYFSKPLIEKDLIIYLKDYQL